MIPAPITALYRAARQRAVLVDRADRGRLVLSGRDRGSYLHGLLTNDIASLKAGEGCYAAYLTAQGRMITDLWVYQLGDVMLVVLDKARKDVLLAKLDQFIFSEDVQLGDVTLTFSGVGIVGPQSAEMVAAVLEGPTAADLAALTDHGNRRGTFQGAAATILRIVDVGEPGYEVLVEPVRAEALRAALVQAGAGEGDPAVTEALRIEGGVPKFGLDMDEETIPLEAGIESRAISLTKGCYVGQEVIIRILHRGHGRVARKLVGLTIGGTEAPAPGSPVMAAEKEIGRVTSSCVSPALGRPVALAYAHRDFIEPGTRVSVEGAEATVSPLPFALSPV